MSNPMSENGENDNGVTGIRTPWGSITGKRTAELITILSLSLTGVLAYAFWEHKADAKQHGSEVVMAVREMAKAQMDSAREQRVTNCLIALEPQERKGALDRCERIAR